MNAMESMSKQELLAALRASGEETLATLHALPPETFAVVRYHQGWTGRQILAHVASIEWTYPRLIMLAERAASPAATDTSTDDGGDTRPANGTDMDAYNARQVAKRAHLSVAALLDEFARNRAATIAAVETVDEALLAVAIRSAGGYCGSLGTVMQRLAVGHVRDHVRDIVGAP